MAATLTISTRDSFVGEIDRENDILLDESSGNIAMSDGKEGCAEIVTHVLRTQQGELQFNAEAGVPYMELVFTSEANLPLWMHYMRKVALAVDGVSEINDFSYQIKENRLTYEMIVNTEIGEVTING